MKDQMRRDLDAWIGLIDRGSTTCPEEPHHPRSECHAWSALPLYAFTRILAGIRQEHGKIVIQPRLLGLPDLSGTAITPLGPVAYRYQGNRYELRLPSGAEGLFIAPSGKKRSFTGTLQYAE